METTSPAQSKTENRCSSLKANNPPRGNSSASRHERLCSICQHPRREDINDDILRWRSPEDIAYDFKLGDRSTVYRHGRALNLFNQRKKNLNPALERLIESVYDAKPSASVILKAIDIYARINGNEAYKAGFADPPKQTIITHRTAHPEDRRVPERGIYPEPSKDAAPSTESALTAAANRSVGALLAVPSSNPAPQAAGVPSALDKIPDPTPIIPPPTSDLAPLERSAEAREDVVHDSSPPASDLQPPQSQTDDDGVTIHFAGAPEYFLKNHPELKRFFPWVSLPIALVLLGSLLWTALFGLGRIAFATAISPTRLSAAPSTTIFPPPLLRPLLPQPPASFFYPPQNSQSKIHNVLKTKPKSIFYSPQKRRFTGARRQDARATT